MAPTPRSKPSRVLPTAQPLLTPPSTASLGQLALVKKTSLKWSWRTMLVIGRTSTPGWSIGTRRNEIPLCLGTSGSVRARTKTMLARWPLEVQIFWPLITH